MLMQESAYKVSAQNNRSKDYGIGQINHRTVKRFRLNKTLLLSDISYSVDAAGMVLADFKRMYGKREASYWTRYNSGQDTKREIYKRLVSRYL